MLKDTTRQAEVTQLDAHASGPDGPAFVPVLMYHDVGGATTTGLKLSPAAFSEHVKVLGEAPLGGLTASAFADCLGGRAAWPAAPVVVTFDDGNIADVAAAEQLAAIGVPATVYLTTSLLGRDGHVDAAALQHLSQMPTVEIGAHSVTHPRLSSIPDAVIREELTRSKGELEDAIGRPVTSFAYPYGAFDRWVRRIAIESGFTSCAGVKNAFSHPGDDPYGFARLIVQAPAAPGQVREWLAGRGAEIVPAGRPWWRSAYQAGRRVRTRAQARMHRPSAA